LLKIGSVLPNSRGIMPASSRASSGMNKIKIKSAAQNRNQKSAPEIRKFCAVAEKFLEESHKLFPQAASELGLEEFESELGENNADVHRRSTALVRETLGAVENLPDTAFRGDD